MLGAPDGLAMGIMTPGRRLVVGEGVEVDGVVGDRVGMGADLRGDDVGCLEVWRGGCCGRELGGEFAEAQVLALALDEAEGGRVPEARGAPVAEDDLVPVG